MSLRQRLVLVLVGSLVLLLTGAAGFRDLLMRRSSEATMQKVLEARLDPVAREHCESPVTEPPPFPPEPRGPRPFGEDGPRPEGRWFGPPPDAAMRHLRHAGPRRPFELFFYGRDWTPRRPGTPPVPESARASLLQGSGFAFSETTEGQPGFVAVQATNWSSPTCTYAALFWPVPPSMFSPSAFAFSTAGLLLACAGVVYLAAGPTVRRIRALAQDVRASAADRYQSGVKVSGRDEISELATAFNEASAAVRLHLDGVERRERALREFVASTTHDVGLPLSALVGHLSEIGERLDRGAGVERELVDGACREAHYISSLLHNLGAAARLETDDALRESRPVQLGALVERVALRHAVLSRGAGVELNHSTPEDPLFATGDVTLLEQAVNNLVHNAIRYNRPGGHVALVLDAEDGRFSLLVRDDGPGVPEDELPRLSEPRFRGGEARSRRPEGTGLGLAIAREVATLHGFSLELRNAEGGGFEAELRGPRGDRS